MESAGPDTAPPQVVILGVPVHAVTFAGLLDAVSTWIARGDRTYQVCTASPEFVMIAQDNAAFRQVLRQADLCVADGVGLLLAARFLGHRLPERVTGSDGLPLIAERAAQAGWSLFLLGAAPGVAEQAAANLTRRFPGLRIAGTYAGSPDPLKTRRWWRGSTPAARIFCSWPTARRARTSGSRATPRV